MSKITKFLNITIAVITTALIFYYYDIHHSISSADLDLLVLRGSGSGSASSSGSGTQNVQSPFKTISKTIHRPRISPDNTISTTLFDDIDVTIPDVTDRHTLLQMAKLAQNAYVHQSDETWIPPPDHLSGPVTSFGWESDDDGLRGHIFTSHDNSTVVVSIKGTSAGLIGGGGPSSKNDKFNDNLLFSCCCARVSWTWSPVCDCYDGGWQCREQCLEQAVMEDSVYYPVATTLFNNITYAYPHSNIWLTGHSLGGALASMLGLTFGVPAITFESPGDRLPSKRLHLPQIPADMTAIYHVYHTADPVAQGTCNGILSPCNAAGFAMETRCHTGMSIVYDTVTKFGWAVDLRHHRIATVINEILEHDWKDDDGKVYVPKPETEEDCIDCFKWEFGEEKDVESIPPTLRI